MEEMELRSLNAVKNKKIAKYDYAYKEMMVDDETDLDSNDSNFVLQVRKKFFNILSRYLQPVKDCIRPEY
jgi:hypothetical protein